MEASRHPLFWDPNVRMKFFLTVHSKLSDPFFYMGKCDERCDFYPEDEKCNFVSQAIKCNSLPLMDPKWVEKLKAFVKLHDDDDGRSSTPPPFKKHMLYLQVCFHFSSFFLFCLFFEISARMLEKSRSNVVIRLYILLQHGQFRREILED